MLQVSIPLSPTRGVGCDSDALPQDQDAEVTALEVPLDSALDEGGWSALLIKIDHEEDGP